MKIFRLLTALLLIAVCAGLGSCGDDELDTKPLEPVIDEITISDTSFDFEANGGEETLSFSTNRDWTVSLANTANGENWCTVTPLNGKAGDNNIQIRVAANKGYDDRNVSLTIAAGGTSRTVIINQKQQNALTLTANKFEVGKNGGKINVEVKANIQYEVIISETSKNWISQSAKTRGLTSNNLSFDIAPSEEYDKRTGEIIIKSGEFSETVHVYQSGEGVLLLTKSEYSVSDKGETIAVDLKRNFAFDVKMPDVDWVQSAAKTRGMSSHTLYYTIAPNETYDSREAEIIFYDKNSAVKDTLKIMQVQKDAIIIGKKEYKISANGETVGIELSSNINYDISLPTDCSWIKVIDKPITKGLEQHIIYLKTDKNDTPNQRNCEIIISNKASNISETIKIIQESGGYVHIHNKLYEIVGETTSVHIDIDANVYYTPIVPAEYYWIKYVRSNGNRLYFDIEENYSNEIRKGHIIIDSPAILKQDTIQIIQTPKSNWIKKTIHLDVAGTLENLINSEQLFQINELTLTGSLNDDDFIVLNDMTSKRGNLSYLDLADTDVKSLMNKAFSWTLSESSLSDFDSKLISIILPKNCKEIGWEVFDGCTRLQIVSLPSTLEKIGMFAFAQTAIKSINIPFKVTRIEEATFLMCQNLSSITMKNVAFIGNNAFTQCSNLSQIDLPKSLVTIEHNAFSDTGIQQVELPNGFTELSDNLFMGCTKLEKVILPASLKFMNDGCFSGCEQLKDIYIYAPTPPSYRDIYDDAFRDVLLDNCVLHISKGSYAAYRHADGWNKFTNIVVEE